MKKSLNLRRSLTGLALGIRLAFGGLNLFAQTPNLQTTVENAKTSQVQRIQLLQERLEQIQKELTELKHVNSTQLETDRAIPAKASVPSPALSEATEPVVSDSSNPKSEPFAFADFTWLTGNARTEDTPYATKFFTPEVRSDVNYTLTSAIRRTTPSADRAKSFVRTRCS
jgi:hypothetical protein